MRAYEIVAGSQDTDGLRACERPLPEPGAHDILVKMHAAALNYRDLMLVRGEYGSGPVRSNLVPLSDGSGEVAAVGAAVTRFRVGERVAGTFFRGWIDGRRPGRQLALGSPPADGVLAEYVVFNEQDAVGIPSHLSYQEAATLPCSAVTAWHALMVIGKLRPGATVLALGTGGVSIFALQLARMAGARVIITSSSDAKLARARALGATDVVNYRATPAWDKEVLRLTDGRGADHIIEVGGDGTLPLSIEAAATHGRIYLIGVLSGRSGNLNPYGLLRKNASLHGFLVGSRQMFDDMNAAIARNGLRPVIDSAFGFDDVPAAYRHLASGAHFGKIVVSF